MIQPLPPSQFTFTLWRNGSLSSLGIATRYYSIVENAGKIRKNAVGYCEGHRLVVRPESQTVAVMFHNPTNFPEDHFWTHLEEREFRRCFQDVALS